MHQARIPACASARRRLAGAARWRRIEKATGCVCGLILAAPADRCRGSISGKGKIGQLPRSPQRPAPRSRKLLPERPENRAAPHRRPKSAPKPYWQENRHLGNQRAGHQRTRIACRSARSPSAKGAFWQAQMAHQQGADRSALVARAVRDRSPPMASAVAGGDDAHHLSAPEKRPASGRRQYPAGRPFDCLISRSASAAPPQIAGSVAKARTAAGNASARYSTTALDHLRDSAAGLKAQPPPAGSTSAR